jgi:hypothetical protein
VHLLLGYRELRHLRHYADDPLVLRLLGLKYLPDEARLSRPLASMDEMSVEQLQGLQQRPVPDRLRLLALPRITLNFDGSLVGSDQFAEGTHRFQSQEERPTQLLPPVLYVGPDRPGAGGVASLGQRA